MAQLFDDRWFSEFNGSSSDLQLLSSKMASIWRHKNMIQLCMTDKCIQKFLPKMIKKNKKKEMRERSSDKKDQSLCK